MADETPATPAEAVEPVPAATTPEAETKPDPAPAPEPDFRAAYVGLQRSQNKLHSQVENLKQTNATLAETVKILKDGQQALLKETLGEDRAKELEKQHVFQATQAAQLRAAQAAEQLIVAQTGLFLEVLQEAGIDPNSPDIDWAKDASTPQEWAQRVGPSIKLAIKRAEETKVRKVEDTLKAKTAKEIAAEAEALAQRQLKESGVDRIDTAKGGATTSTAERIAKMDPNSAEFKKFYADVLAGRSPL